MLFRCSGLALATGLVLGSARAEPVVGIDYTPLSRADLVWVEEGKTSGTGVGEFDGLTRPSLSLWAGVRRTQWDVLGSLGAARIASTETSSEGTRVTSAAGLRIGLDAQKHLGDFQQVRPWAGIGAYGTIPFARDEADFYSKADATDAEYESAVDRARIGGFGARCGVGVGVPLGETVQVGAVAHVIWHGAASFTEDGSTLSTLTWIQPALRLETTLR